MKKSKAVNLIAEHLIEPKSDCPIRCAELILERLIEAGMLPPTVELCAAGEIMPTKELLDHSEIDYIIAWEPEDE